MVFPLALIALGSGSTATAHVTLSQTDVTPSSSPQNPLAFLDVSDAPAIVR